MSETMDFEWKQEYGEAANLFLKMHFGGARGVTGLFPCMRDEYKWGEHRPDVLDPRIPIKNNTEYHGLERHAWQYHATAQYDFAYHHWLLAACWRREDMMANNFNDEGHQGAVRYAIKQALYNKELHQWQQSLSSPPPIAEAFGLSSDNIQKKEEMALREIEDARQRYRKL